MITLQLNKNDLLNIESELNLKVGGVKELSSQQVMTEIANAVFTVTGKAFIKAMNMEAKGNHKAYHHIYEWNKVGMPSGRLFFLSREHSTNGVLRVKPGFAKSRTSVPIAPELLVPGKTGKSVASKYVFRDKAYVMEYGKPVIYRASKNIPIAENGQIRFVAAGTVIKNYNPGGKEVKGSFEKFFHAWYATRVQSIINASGIIKSIDNETAMVLNKKNAGPAEVKKAVISLLKQYSKDEILL
jgi:hypothetical protein